MPTMHEYIDQAVAHLVAQGGRSIHLTNEGEDPACRYRGAGGRRCALGVFLTDEQYNPELEGFTVGRENDVSEHTRAHKAIVALNALFADDGAPYRPSDCRDKDSAIKFWGNVQGALHDFRTAAQGPEVFAEDVQRAAASLKLDVGRWK